MAIDEAMALACRQGLCPPTLRFYTWAPAALSLGFFQEIGRDVDPVLCRQGHYDLVRRPTGGKAVLHGHDLTYSIISRRDNPLFPGDLYGTFMVIAGGLITGLRKMGIPAVVFGPSARRGRPSDQTNPSCFASAMGFEIGVNGKKLIGSAQRRWRDGFLQHGSILCTDPPGQDPALFSGRNPENDPEKSSTSLSTLLRKPPDEHGIKRCLVQGMEAGLPVRFIRAGLTDYEQGLASRLVREKYGTTEWTLGRGRTSRARKTRWERTTPTPAR